MASASELPDLVREFTDMSTEYLRQETVEPAKQLGRYGGFALGAGVCWAIGAILLSIALLRVIIDALPDGPNWSALGYLITVLVLALFSALMMRVASTDRKRGDYGD